MRALSPEKSRTRTGFTLVEMLVVAGIIVLIVTLAVPAFNVISGNRSVDSAQNQLAAIIGRARQEAIGLQDYRGVILFQDPNTGRTGAAEVWYPTPGTLDLTPNHDSLLLPTGISFRMVETTGAFTPMNVVMFNNRGEFVSQAWQIMSNLSGPLTTSSQPGTALNLIIRTTLQPGQSGQGQLPTIPAAMPQIAFSGNTAFGFVLFPDEGAYQAAYSTSNSNQYLINNGITFIIGKYNGNLLRSE